MKSFRKILSVLLALLLLLTAAGAVAEGTSGAASLTVGVREINSNGDIYLNLTPAELEAAGIHVHDMIKATVNGKTIEMPVEYTLDHALFGQPFCLIENGDVLLLLCRGCFCIQMGLGTQIPEGDGFAWVWAEGTSAPESVTIELTQAGGFNPPEAEKVGIMSLLNISKEALEAYVKVQNYADTCLKYNGLAAVTPGVCEYLPGNSIAVTSFDSLSSLLLGLNAGEVDWALVSESVADYICARDSSFRKQLTISREGDRDYLMDLMYGAASNDYAIMLPADKAPLAEEINTALAAMREDGTLDQLVRKYITEATEEGISEQVEFDSFDGADTIRFVVTGDLPPMDYMQTDGSPAGFSTAVLAEIGRRLKKNIRVIPTENLSRALELETGRADAAFWTRNKISVFEWMSSFTPEALAEKALAPQMPLPKKQFSALVALMGEDDFLWNAVASDIPDTLISTDSYYTEPVVLLLRAE